MVTKVTHARTDNFATILVTMVIDFDDRVRSIYPSDEVSEQMGTSRDCSEKTNLGSAKHI
jgi:hypothetical protein